LAPAGGRRRGQSFVPVGAAQPSSVGSFGRNRRFRHFNKLTVRDFAGANETASQRPVRASLRAVAPPGLRRNRNADSL